MTLLWAWYRTWGPLYRLHRRWRDPHIRRYGWLGSDCPWCGADNEGVYLRKPWFVATGGGESAVPGEYTVHWCEGTMHCWRCKHPWWVQESD